MWTDPAPCSEFAEIVDAHDLCGECPVWSVSRQVFYWTDMASSRTHSYDWISRSLSTSPRGFEVCGFGLNDTGELVAGNSEGFWLWDGQNAPISLSEPAGRSIPINDCVADPEGGLIAGSCFYRADVNDSPTGQLLRLGPDGSLTTLDEGFKLANGLAFSPEGRTLYFADSATRTIYAYDFDSQRGSVKNRRVFVQVPSTEGVPDGLAVDAEGFVWCAQWFGSGLVRYDPDGCVERRAFVPAKQTSNLAFGGSNLMDIVVTSAATPDALPLSPDGYSSEGYIGGKLFHANLGIAGKPEYLCRFRKPG